VKTPKEVQSKSKEEEKDSSSPREEEGRQVGGEKGGRGGEGFLISG